MRSNDAVNYKHDTDWEEVIGFEYWGTTGALWESSFNEKKKLRNRIK